jgi:transcriptional regulator with XRE-family HTH domain
MPHSSNLTLGDRLREHRENRGMTLDALAEVTKVKRSLLADLERDDISRLPTGIYRRAIIREYGKAIGFPARELIEGLRIFETVDSQSVAPRGDVTLGDRDSDFRLMLADASSLARSVVYGRLWDALGALALVLLAGCLVTLIGGFPYWSGTGIIALIWYPITAVLGDRSLTRMVTSARRRSWPLRRTITVWQIVDSVRGLRKGARKRKIHVRPIDNY